MDELLKNYMEHKKNPRPINKPVEITESVEISIIDEVVTQTCDLLDLDYNNVLTGLRKRELVTARQIISYISMGIGFKPEEIANHLNWDRTSIIARSKKCSELSYSIKSYRKAVNTLAEKFGVDPITEYI